MSLNWINYGDVQDFQMKIARRGLPYFFKLFNLNQKERTSNTFNSSTVQDSNWWIIPAVKERWNSMITGSPTTHYEDYVWENYLKNRQNLKLLSIGCGTASHEIRFAKYPNMELVQGIDLAKNLIKIGQSNAIDKGLQNVKLQCVALEEYQPGFKFDVILFHQSLHHFKNPKQWLTKYIQPLMAKDAIVVAHEYVGPKRIQLNSAQLDFSNQLLAQIPTSLKLMSNGKEKRKVYAPGLIRMLITDPSESVDSDKLDSALRSTFEILDHRNFGGNILHLLLKDISHNFLNTNYLTTNTLDLLFKKEDEFIANALSDFQFYVLQ